MGFCLALEARPCCRLYNHSLIYLLVCTPKYSLFNTRYCSYNSWCLMLCFTVAIMEWSQKVLRCENVKMRKIYALLLFNIRILCHIIRNNSSLLMLNRRIVSGTIILLRNVNAKWFVLL